MVLRKSDNAKRKYRAWTDRSRVHSKLPVRQRQRETERERERESQQKQIKLQWVLGNDVT